jgi:hypothetical protein
VSRCSRPIEIRHRPSLAITSSIERGLEEDHWMSLGFHRRVLAVGASLVAALALAVSPALAASPSVHVLADGLNNPRGIDVGADGRVYVAEGGTGDAGTGRISVISGRTRSTVLGGLPSGIEENEVAGPTNVALQSSGNLVAVIGKGDQSVDSRFNTVIRVNGDRQLGDIQAYIGTDPAQPLHGDPNDQEGNPLDSNPYGAAWLSGSRTLVADAGANALFLVGPNGDVQTVARFPIELVSTAHVPFPVPPMLPAEAVPTSVAVGPDGYWYVGQLRGFPFTPGSSHIWRIAPWARDVQCDASAPTDACQVWVDGLTSVTGLDFGADGTLYVVEISKFGVLGIGPNNGALLEIPWGSKTATELVPGTLTAPGDVAVGRDGTVYVTNNSTSVGGGQVLAIR